MSAYPSPKSSVRPDPTAGSVEYALHPPFFTSQLVLPGSDVRLHRGLLLLLAQDLHFGVDDPYKLVLIVSQLFK